jgi:hypothetical protein
VVLRIQESQKLNMKLRKEYEGNKKLEEKIEPDPRDQKIKELQKEVNALGDLVLAMQDLRYKHHEWLDYCLTYLNKTKPEFYEQKEKELSDSYEQAIQECNTLSLRVTSLVVRI